MKKEKLLDLVEALREAGQQDHGDIMAGGDIEICPGIEGNNRFCECGAANHNAAVDAAAKALVEALKSLPEFDCGSCKRKACPHHGPFPKSPGPPHGCSAYIGGRT